MEKYYYKINFNDNYVVGAYAVNEGSDYDYYGQIAEYPDIAEGWYKLVNNDFVIDEQKKAEIIAKREEEAKKPTWQETIEAQTFYTAMMTDTLIDSEEVM